MKSSSMGPSTLVCYNGVRLNNLAYNCFIEWSKNVVSKKLGKWLIKLLTFKL